MKTEVLSILIDLDLILDTRLALIQVFYPDLYKSLINKKELYNREGNNFVYNNKTLNSAIFEQLYKLRNKNIIKYSNPTFLAYWLVHLLDDFTSNYTDEDPNYEIKLYINVYPYHFNEEEIKWLHVLMLNFVPTTIEVEFIYKNIYDLTAEFINKNKILELYMYSGLTWLDYIASTKQYLKHKLLNQTLFIPKIYNKKSLLSNKSITMYDELQYYYSYIMSLDFLEMSSITDYTTSDFEKK